MSSQAATPLQSTGVLESPAVLLEHPDVSVFRESPNILKDKMQVQGKKSCPVILLLRTRAMLHLD